ncbi:hypothetical protein BGZ51_000293 [Haplosporangium sp. Z 767]|nr:hypothetical protein BGZ51_000293 [Haplosporangium sp. Z 767]KAF9195678.1 hypothetical protein BGZ50_003848 [Haplosporangium sp. Z 11]
MLLSTTPSLGCKITAVKPIRPAFTTRSTSSSSIPQLTALKIPQQPKRPMSASITIPSPPLTPRHGYDDEPKKREEDENIFPLEFQRRHRLLREEHEYQMSMMQQSSSAPSAMSPLEMRYHSSVTTGFTFSSNISTSEAKKDRENYEFFLSTVEDDYWKSVSTIRTTYFFDGIGRGGGFLAIPHLASHGNTKTNVICRLLEAWLTKKLVEPTISDSIPVLEDNIQSSVQSIEHHLRQDPKVWSGISKSVIHIRCGHVFMLDKCCDDETIVHLGAAEFYQDYPLFVDVEIKMHCDATQQPKENSTELLIAFQNVVKRSKVDSEDRPFVHRAIICEPKRRPSQGGNTAV